MPKATQTTTARRAFVLEDDRGHYATASRLASGAYRLCLQSKHTGSPLDEIRSVIISRDGVRTMIARGLKITRRV